MTDVFTGDETWIEISGIASRLRNAAWPVPGDQRHQICKLRFHSKETIFDIFNDKGSFTVDFFFSSEKSAITGTAYIETVLPQIVREIENQRQTTGTLNVLIHHGNASLHKTRAVTQCFDEQLFQSLSHQPYTPDLAPRSGCFIFLKDRLTARKLLACRTSAKPRSIPR